eukprot:3527500-Rhodomonas_salina.3
MKNVYESAQPVPMMLLTREGRGPGLGGLAARCSVFLFEVLFQLSSHPAPPSKRLEFSGSDIAQEGLVFPQVGALQPPPLH